MKGLLIFLAFFVCLFSCYLCAMDLVIAGTRCGQVVETADQLAFTFEAKDIKNLAALSAQNVDGFSALNDAYQAISGDALSAPSLGTKSYPLQTTEDRVKWESFRTLMAPFYANWNTLSYRVLRVTSVTMIMSFLTSHVIAFIWWKLTPLVIYAHLRHHPFLLKHVYFYVIPKEDRHLFEDDYEDDADFELTAKVNQVLLKIPPSASQEIKDRAAQLARMERLRKLKKLKAKRELQEGKKASESAGKIASIKTASESTAQQEVDDNDFKAPESAGTNDKNPKPSEPVAAPTESAASQQSPIAADPSKDGSAKEESKGVTLFSVSMTVGVMVAAIFV